MNKINEVQVKMMGEIEREEISLPNNHSELFDLVKNILMAFDFEKEELPMMEKCKEQFIKFSMQKGDAGGEVYISGVKYILENRKYFKLLSESMRQRGIKDPSREIVRSMIKDGLLRLGSTGVKYAATLKGQKMVEEKENEEKELRQAMREIAIKDRLGG